MLEPDSNTPESLDNSSGFTTLLQKDEDGNSILDFPFELLETMGWGEGDLLDIQSFAGRIVISKVSGG